MDLKDLYALIAKFEKTGLSELTFKTGEDEVTLKKPQAGAVLAPREVAMPAGAAAAQAPAPVHVQTAAQGSDIEVIRAPLVGTFYRSPAPDAAPFVEKGDRVKKGQTLCILEAMKLMNEFQAEFNLEIIAVLAENGAMVEFGTPLFEVRRT